MLQKKVLLTSVAEITFNTSVYSQLQGQEAFLRAQVVTVGVAGGSQAGERAPNGQSVVLAGGLASLEGGWMKVPRHECFCSSVLGTQGRGQGRNVRGWEPAVCVRDGALLGFQIRWRQY